MTLRQAATAGRTAELLDQRTLNRALLERQMLLRRSSRPVGEAIEHLVGLQAQNPPSPYYGLWPRLSDFDPAVLSQLIDGREAVRLAVMRGTIHLVTAEDALVLRPLVQPLYDRDLRTNTQYRVGLDGVDLAALADAGRTLVEEEPRTAAALRSALAERWPDRDPASLAHGVRGLLPLVHVPPRGMWGRSGPVAMTTAEAWLGRSLGATPSLDEMFKRYLAAFGPASVMDAQAWSGLSRLGEIAERLRPRLRSFRNERGKELFDLPDAHRPDPDTPAPPRYLPDLDNVLLSHADRSRVVSDEVRKRIISKNGVVPGTVLVDGVVAATWRIDTDERTARLVVTPFDSLPASDRAALADEGAALLAFAAPDADDHDVGIAAAT